MPVSTSTPERRRWIFLVSVIAFSIVIYGAVVALVARQQVARPEGVDVVRVVLLFLGVGSLAGSYLLMPRPDGSGTSGRRLAPDAFHKKAFLALVIAESAAVYGLAAFFIGRHVVDFGVLAVGAIALMLLHILPQGLRYWDGGSGPGAGAGPGPLGPS